MSLNRLFSKVPGRVAVTVRVGEMVRASGKLFDSTGEVGDGMSVGTRTPSWADSARPLEEPRGTWRRSAGPG